MNPNYIIVPDSGMKLVDGTIVQLARFPETRWIVHNGWYTYEGSQYAGWYLTSVPDGNNLPFRTEDLIGLVVISPESGDGYIRPPHPTFPPGPPGPGFNPCWPPIWPPAPPCPEVDAPAYFSIRKEAMLDAAFITVNTIEDRDNLKMTCIPDGKIVRVNDVEGSPAYFAYNKSDKKWEKFSFDGSDASIIAGAGLEGGGPLTSDVTLSLAEIGSHTYVGTGDNPVVASLTRDDYGRISGATFVDIKPLIDKAIAAANKYTDDAVAAIKELTVRINGTGTALVDVAFNAEHQKLTFEKGVPETSGDESWIVIDD